MIETCTKAMPALWGYTVVAEIKLVGYFWGKNTQTCASVACWVGALVQSYM